MGTRKAGAVALNLLSYVFRIMGIVLCVLVVLLCFSGIVVELSRMLPDVIAGYGLMPTPFGGVFRLDYALVAVICFGLDYLCSRLSRTVR